MLSVVSVYNRADVFQRCLKSSLTTQQQPLELIEVDNSDGRFDRAATALNWGAAQATTGWVVFAHQDVVLLDPRWSMKVSKLLEELQPSGWCGVVGRDHRGRWQGLIRDRDCVHGEPFESHREVQTLDEVLLIHRREQEFTYFDETPKTWHVYGVDACCQAILSGHKNYVLSAPIWHDSPSTNRAGLEAANAYIADKYGSRLSPIHACCGDIPFRFAKRGSYRLHVLKDRLRAWRHAATTGVRPRKFDETRRPLDAVDCWTAEQSQVDCLRGSAWYERIEAIGMADHSKHPRRVVHHFNESTELGSQPTIVVLGPERCRGPFIEPNCSHWITLEILPRCSKFAASIGRHQAYLQRRELCRDQDDRYWLLSEYRSVD